MSSDRLLLMVHGAGPQPEADLLLEHWVEALRRGVERDHRKRLKAFDAAQKSMYHYASERESELALADRREALDALRDSESRYRRLIEHSPAVMSASI